MLKMDYSKNYNEKPEPGVYEAVVGKTEIRHTNEGKEYFSIPLIIRNDVEQRFQNAIIWDSIRAMHSDKAISYKTNVIGQAVGIEEGREFANLEEWGKAIKGFPLKVTVGSREYNGKTYQDIKKYEKTDTKEMKHKFKKAEDEPDFKVVDENDDEVPF